MQLTTIVTYAFIETLSSELFRDDIVGDVFEHQRMNWMCAYTNMLPQSTASYCDSTLSFFRFSRNAMTHPYDFIDNRDAPISEARATVIDMLQRPWGGLPLSQVAIEILTSTPVNDVERERLNTIMAPLLKLLDEANRMDDTMPTIPNPSHKPGITDHIRAHSGVEAVTVANADDAPIVLLRIKAKTQHTTATPDDSDTINKLQTIGEKRLPKADIINEMRLSFADVVKLDEETSANIEDIIDSSRSELLPHGDSETTSDEFNIQSFASALKSNLPKK